MYRIILFMAIIVAPFYLIANPSRDSIQAYNYMKLPENKAKVDSLLKAASFYRDKVNVEPLLKEALRLVDKFSYKEMEAKVLDLYGVVLRNFSRYDEALKCHMRALKIAEETKNVKNQIFSYNNIGVVYRRLNENSTALDYHLKALKLAEEIKDYYSESVSLNSIGNIHIALGNYTDAIKYFKKCLPVAKTANNSLGISMNLNNIGEAYENMNLIDSAIYYYNESLKYSKKINREKGIAICYNALGNAYQKQKRYEEAVVLYNKALKINLKLGDRIYNADTYNNLGFAHLHLNMYNKAKSAFTSALRISLEIGSKKEIKNAYEGLMQIAEKEKEFAQALTYSKKVKLYGDSIVNEKNTRYVREMEAIYGKEKEQQQIHLLKIKQKSTFWFAIAGFGLFFLLFVSGSLLYRRNKLAKENDLLQRELEVRKEIATDLHDDMGSALSSISILSEIAGKEIHEDCHLRDLIDKIKANTKNTQDATDDIIWLVNPSNDKFHNLSLRIREYAIPLFELKKINFDIHFPEELYERSLPMELRRNIFLIVKEAVNNLVKYADCTQASIKAFMDGNMLVVNVWDNGKGFDMNKNYNRNGLKNMQARAENIHADYKIESSPNQGCSITFSLII